MGGKGGLRAWCMRASLSGVYPAGGLRWRFAWGFDFGHGLSLPFVAAFGVLRGLLGVLVGAMGPFWPGMALSGLWGWGGGLWAVSRIMS